MARTLTRDMLLVAMEYARTQRRGAVTGMDVERAVLLNSLRGIGAHTSSVATRAQALFRAMRDHGIEPHPLGEQADGDLALCLPDAEEDGETDEERAENSSLLSINEPKMGIDDETYGPTTSIYLDIVHAKAGITRALQEHEPTLYALYPDGPIPRPGELLSALTGSSFSRFSKCTWLFVLWYLYSRKTRPVFRLFTNGWTGRFWNEGETPIVPRFSLPDDAPAGVSWTDVIDYCGAAASSFMIVTDQGWDPWYWNETDSRPVRDPEIAMIYHRYAVDVDSKKFGREYPENVDYDAEVCDRKSLGIAAFGYAVGTWIAWLDDFCQEHELGCRVTDFIWILEAGKEMSNGTWSGNEYGKFLALVTGPIKHLAPLGIRTRAAAVASWVSSDAWAVHLNFIRSSFSGVSGELDRWRPWNDALWTWTDTIWRWVFLCEDGGFFWPPLPVDSYTVPTLSGFVDEVGFHWYHQDERVGEGYQNETRFESDLEEFADLVSSHPSWGVRSWSVSEIGFQSEKNHGLTTPWHPRACPRFQAAVLVRRLLFALAKGASWAGWHCHMSQTALYHDSWDQFSTHGLREDMVEEATLAAERALSFRWNEKGWRKPSWYAFRRLAWLLGQAGEIRVIYNAGLTVIRLTASHFAFGLPDAGGYTESSTGVLRTFFKYAYVCWGDSDIAKSWSFALEDSNEEGYRLLSLVPDVTHEEIATAVDSSGWPTGEAVNWEWSGWDRQSCIVGQSGSRISVDVRVPGTSVLIWTPVPICILTNAEPTGSTTTRATTGVDLGQHGGIIDDGVGEGGGRPGGVHPSERPKTA